MCKGTYLLEDHPFIKSSKGLGGWVWKWQFFLPFSTVFMLTCGWVRKSPKMCWRNIGMDPSFDPVFDAIFQPNSSPTEGQNFVRGSAGVGPIVMKVQINEEGFYQTKQLASQGPLPDTLDSVDPEIWKQTLTFHSAGLHKSHDHILILLTSSLIRLWTRLKII